MIENDFMDNGCSPGLVPGIRRIVQDQVIQKAFRAIKIVRRKNQRKHPVTLDRLSIGRPEPVMDIPHGKTRIQPENEFHKRRNGDNRTPGQRVGGFINRNLPRSANNMHGMMIIVNANIATASRSVVNIAETDELKSMLFEYRVHHQSLSAGISG
ncbi:MAG: hypothetical protein K8S55_05625 [Phycisphaerae bacterium]|nr:hypothetical protein [Phycisphaerae bacterium]